MGFSPRPPPPLPPPPSFSTKIKRFKCSQCWENLNLYSYLQIGVTGFRYINQFYHMAVHYKIVFLLHLIILNIWKAIETLMD